MQITLLRRGFAGTKGIIGVLGFIVRRILGAIPTLFAIITLAFFMIRLAPGGPFDGERPLPAAIQKNIRDSYHLNDPLWKQYIYYVGNVLQGDFGPSYKKADFTVTELVSQGFPISMELGIIAIILALSIGIPLGAIAALQQNSRMDYSLMAIAMIGITIPNFVIGPLLSYQFGIAWKILPAGGWDGGALPNLILPVFCLALPQIAYIARMTRGSMIEVLRSNFIRTARAKGIPSYLILRRHALKAALLPVVSYLGPAAAAIITGSVVIEEIFSIPGIGRDFVKAAINRDYTHVMGVVILYGALIIVFNLVVDVLYSFLDPKIRYKR